MEYSDAPPNPRTSVINVAHNTLERLTIKVMTQNPHSPAPQPRPVFSQLPAYSAGKPAAKVEGLEQYKLSSNENPFGPVASVAEVLSSFDQVHRYPDPLSTELRTKLSEQLGVDAEDWAPFSR